MPRGLEGFKLKPFASEEPRRWVSEKEQEWESEVAIRVWGLQSSGQAGERGSIAITSQGVKDEDSGGEGGVQQDDQIGCGRRATIVAAPALP
jgi:hypothetical protein